MLTAIFAKDEFRLRGRMKSGMNTQHVSIRQILTITVMILRIIILIFIIWSKLKAL